MEVSLPSPPKRGAVLSWGAQSPGATPCCPSYRETTFPASGSTISGQWLDKLMERLEGVLTRLKRVHFKSLGGLLACQEALAEEGRLVTANLPGPPTTPAIAING